jgi:hypothetical protein
LTLNAEKRGHICDDSSCVQAEKALYLSKRLYVARKDQAIGSQLTLGRRWERRIKFNFTIFVLERIFQILIQVTQVSEEKISRTQRNRREGERETSRL